MVASIEAAARVRGDARCLRRGGARPAVQW